MKVYSQRTFVKMTVVMTPAVYFQALQSVQEEHLHQRARQHSPQIFPAGGDSSTRDRRDQIEETSSGAWFNAKRKSNTSGPKVDEGPWLLRERSLESQPRGQETSHQPASTVHHQVWSLIQISIFGKKMKRSAFPTNAQSRIVPVFINGVLGPPSPSLGQSMIFSCLDTPTVELLRPNGEHTNMVCRSVDDVLGLQLREVT